MKYILILIVLLLIGVPGCSHVIGDTVGSTAIPSVQTEIIPNISDIIAKQAETAKKVNTCRTSVYLEVNLQSGTSDKSDMSLTANMKSSIDSQNRLLSSIVSTTLVIKEAKKEMEQRIIAAGENIYLKDSTQAQWQLKSLDKTAAETLWNEQDAQLTGSRYAELISPESLVYSGKEKSNGQSCFVLKQPLDTSKLGDITPELQQQLQNVPGLSLEQLGKVIKSGEVSYLIDEQTYHLREFRLDARVNQDVQGQSITGAIKQYCRYDAFNEPVSIQIPEVKQQ